MVSTPRPDCAPAEVGAEDAGKTLAAFVRKLHPDLSWNQVRKLIRTGRVHVNDTPNYEDALRIAAGQRIRTTPTATAERSPVLARERLVHVDHDIVVVYKPAGVVTAPFKPGAQARRLHKVREETDTLVHRTELALARLDPKRRHGTRSANASQMSSLGVVQRLDKGTTGLLVFARTRKARQALEDQVKGQELEREYLAIVRGQANEGEHVSYIVPDRGDGFRGSWRSSAGKPPKNARYAKTTVFVEERFGDHHTLVSCQLATGRQHQIRIHMAESGHPLVGETIYGKTARRRETEARRNAGLPELRPLLHAHQLGLRHPQTGVFMRFDAALPEDFQQAIERLRRE